MGSLTPKTFSLMCHCAKFGQSAVMLHQILDPKLHPMEDLFRDREHLACNVSLKLMCNFPSHPVDRQTSRLRKYKHTRDQKTTTILQMFDYDNQNIQQQSKRILHNVNTMQILTGQYLDVSALSEEKSLESLCLERPLNHCKHTDKLISTMKHSSMHSQHLV